MSRLWILPVLGLIAALAFACRDSGDDQPQSVSSVLVTATASQPAKASPAITATVSPNPTVQADWATYTDPDRKFTVRYPNTWFVQDGGTSKVSPLGALTSIFSTFQLGTVGPRFPRGSVKVDLIVWSEVSTPGLDCQGQPSGSTSAVLADTAGWRTVTQNAASYDASLDGVTLSDRIVAFKNGECYSLTAYFADDSPREDDFQTMLNSFRFTD